MNLLRYLLSLGILINHFNVLMGHEIPYFISHDRIGGFFALSGFLMYHSYTKVNNLKKFVVHRSRRILPTYIFIVLLCALGLGCISTLPLLDYFSSIGFWKYLAANLSFLNWLCPGLPGVFTGPEYEIWTVNGSLWTMKVEWVLDLSVPLFVWLIGKNNWKKEKVALVIVIFSMFTRLIVQHLYYSTGNNIYSILGRQFLSQMGFFYCGMLVYFYREWLSKRLPYVIGLGFILYILTPIVPYGNIFIAPPAVALLFLGISMIGKTVTAFIHVNCVSYNIFLVHYPIVQFCVWLGLKDSSVWLSFSIVLISTIVLALLTNKFIDRPFNKRHKIIGKI